MRNSLRTLLAASIATVCVISAARAEELRDKALELFKPLPSTIPAVSENPITPDKITLGNFDGLQCTIQCELIELIPHAGQYEEATQDKSDEHKGYNNELDHNVAQAHDPYVENPKQSSREKHHEDVWLHGDHH